MTHFGGCILWTHSTSSGLLVRWMDRFEKSIMGDVARIDLGSLMCY